MHDCEFKKYLGRKSFTTLREALKIDNEYIRSEEQMLISHPAMGGETSQAARKDQPHSHQQSYRKDNNIGKKVISREEVFRAGNQLEHTRSTSHSILLEQLSTQ